VGRIFIDYLRNGLGATTISACSVRTREGLPVSVPVFRQELLEIQGANVWNIHNLHARLKSARTLEKLTRPRQKDRHTPLLSTIPTTHGCGA